MLHTRRMFVAAGAAGLASSLLARAQGMSLHLSCGAIGVKATQTEAIDYAARFGFDSVDADGRYLGSLAAGDLTRLLDGMRERKVAWAIAGFPVEFRKDDAAFADSMKTFPTYAAGLERAGVKNVTTWISPASAERTYLENMRVHSRRLREAAGVMQDHGLRFGLEYVAPKTLWAAQRYPFVHTMAEMKDLLGEIGRPNAGFVLDSWHWYTAGDKKQDVLSLRAEQVVSIDLNDAPAGVPVDQQVDSRRELPGATGVIDIAAFLGALKEIGFTGPVRVEPFNEAVRRMPPEQAIAAAKAALDKVFAQVA
ncbi:MAG TPA: sugar phosphate isomerase/epimerase family protein [Verrucomicrobiae bacterium]|nr:sugar phosphate isomerase/epimerase family protein [Verrucomicrobiae bacterium]